MIFHEIYGCYYQAVSRILALAVEGKLTEADMKRICDETAFSESFLAILPALKDEKWQLIYPAEDETGTFRTPIRCKPDLPLTTLEKRWLKAITMDARFQLFLPPLERTVDPASMEHGKGGGPDHLNDGNGARHGSGAGEAAAGGIAPGLDLDFLEGVEPLFTSEDFVLFDKYEDGDPYTDPAYIKIFQTLRRAIHSRCRAEIVYPDRHGRKMVLRGWPYRLEYSEKDDKFRVLLSGTRKADVLNVGRILACHLVEENGEKGQTRQTRAMKQPPRRVSGGGNAWFTLELVDERNALERVMLHFAHFRKEAERLDDKRYRVKVYYKKNDASELVIRVLSFGPLVKVTEPEEFVELVKDKLRQQMETDLFEKKDYLK